MVSKIRILDEKTINQVAAGEVIEDSSSVIKELVENSIDANSSEIEIETRQAGRQHIKVSDNGEGMSFDDALLCLERHATSKIKQTSDLNSLLTLGFRGEALAAIAAISKLTILTKERGSKEDASLVYVEGGKILKAGVAARQSGTSVEVNSLFFNVPVRKSFQKSLSQDYAEIHKVLTGLAFCHPFSKITWVSESKKELDFLPQGDNLLFNLEKRIKQACCKDFGNELIPLDQSGNGISLRGFISSPAFHRTNKSVQYLALNNRLIQNSLVSKAVAEGYGIRLPAKRFPGFVLLMELSPERVDANVHPQKKQVRLAEEEFLFQFIKESIDLCLQKKMTHSFAIDMPKVENLEYPVLQEVPRYMTEDFTTYSNYPTPSPALPLPIEPEILCVWQNYILVNASTLEESFDPAIALFEQRSLEAKLLYEKLCKHDIDKATQVLLFPEVVELSVGQAQLIEANMNLFQRIGFQLNLFSGGSLLVEAIPQTFDILDIKDFIMNSVDEIQHLKYLSQEELASKWALYICRFIKRKNISKETAKEWVKELLSFKDPWTDPCGKPLVHFLSSDEFAKRFK